MDGSSIEIDPEKSFAKAHYEQHCAAKGFIECGGERLDMRVAFSEGWGNAWSGMALATQFYTDSAGTGQQSGSRVHLVVGLP